MKQIITTFSILASITLFGQNYTVIHSIGKIYDTSTGAYLRKGSKVGESTELKFETKGAKAAVLSSSRGRFIIQKNSTSQQQGDLAYTLSSVISPVRGRLSTRAGGINNLLDFQKHFGEGSVAIIGKEYSVAVSPNAYPMNESKFFYAQYTYKGERINKKLPSNGDSLVFAIASLYAVDDSAIDPGEVSDAQLFYYNSDSEESSLITSLEFGVVTAEDLETLSGSFSDLSEEDRTTALLEIINDLYGKCSKAQLLKSL